MSIIVNRHITFIDSLQFYNSSLDTLSSNLEDNDFKYLVSEFGINKLKSLKRKDAYPYEWVDSYEKFKHPSLPGKKYFYSSIDDGKRGKGNGNISNEQYQHLQNVWKIFNSNTFEDFHDHYLKKDVLLIADIFEIFIFTNLKYYSLDPCHHFSAPGLSSDAMLKLTKIELQKINYPDRYMLFEQGRRGGVSYINKRYSEANNKYCLDYDKTKREKYILYLDMNNLYGHAMSQYLPYSNFKWVKNIDKIKQKLMTIKNNSSTRYILEVNLEYPQELHDSHNDYPLAPEKIKIPKEWLSDYSLEIANAHNISTGKVKKLVPNLMNKSNYVIHYRNLQQCLELGMKLKKIHRVLKFKQKDWMKPYIDFNTQKRNEATNEADKNHFTLLNNAAYGKTMENMRKRIKMRVVKNAKDFIRYTSRPTCVKWKVFENNLAAIHEKNI